MGYIQIENVKKIRETVKKRFPEYKLSITREHHSTVFIKILAGPKDLGCTYKQLNTYYLEDIENEDLRKLSTEIENIVRTVSPVSYRETGDYGNQPDYYLSIHVGQFDKPYLIK